MPDLRKEGTRPFVPSWQDAQEMLKVQLVQEHIDKQQSLDRAVLCMQDTFHYPKSGEALAEVQRILTQHLNLTDYPDPN